MDCPLDFCYLHGRDIREIVPHYEIRASMEHIYVKGQIYQYIAYCSNHFLFTSSTWPRSMLSQLSTNPADLYESSLTAF